VIEGHAVEPDEILDDQYLELRARDLSKQLRCLVCRNESIDESNSMIAKDLRAVLRERLLEGDSDREVMSFLVNRYGEYILLKPKLDKKNIILWFLGPGLFIVSLLALIFSFKRKRNFYVRNNKSS
tara:strand:+ start:166 stop:543 length:378 start_codon:yes stop_codon:yes gene_type:complete